MLGVEYHPQWSQKSSVVVAYFIFILIIIKDLCIFIHSVCLRWLQKKNFKSSNCPKFGQLELLQAGCSFLSFFINIFLFFLHIYFYFSCTGISCGMQLSCPVACGILVPQPGIEPTSPMLEGRFFTTRPPEKSLLFSLDVIPVVFKYFLAF